MALSPRRGATSAERVPCRGSYRPCRYSGGGGGVGGTRGGDEPGPPLAAGCVVACALSLVAWLLWPPEGGSLSGSLATSPETLGVLVEVLRAATPLGSGDEGLVFVDLGSGDGRVVREVVRCLGCRGVGVELLPEATARAVAAASAELPADIANRARFLCADMGHVDLAEADVVFMYVPHVMARDVILGLLPQSGLRAGARVVVADGPPEGLPYDCGLRHIRRGPRSAPSSLSSPPVAVDVFEWRGRASPPRSTVSHFFTCAEAEQPKISLRALTPAAAPVGG